MTHTAVDDIDRNAPTKTPSFSSAPVKLETTPHTSIMSAISARPPPRATPCTCFSLAYENSTPSVNRRKMMPNCASVSTCVGEAIGQSNVLPVKR